MNNEKGRQKLLRDIRPPLELLNRAIKNSENNNSNTIFLNGFEFPLEWGNTMKIKLLELKEGGNDYKNVYDYIPLKLVFLSNYWGKLADDLLTCYLAS